MTGIILIGMKGCGKTTIGTLLAQALQLPFIDSDSAIEQAHQQDKGEALSFRQIFQRYGDAYFNALDQRALKLIAQKFGETGGVFACGGRTPLQEENQHILSGLGEIIFLDVEKRVLLKRILAQGVPAFFPYQDDPEKSLDTLLNERWPTYKKLANRTLHIGEETAEEVVQAILSNEEVLRGYGEN